MDFWTSLYNKYYKIWDHPKVNNEKVPRKESETLVDVQATTAFHEPDVVDTVPEPIVIEEPTVIEEPKVDAQKFVDAPIVVDEPKNFDEPQVVDEPKVVDEEPKIILEDPKLNQVDPVRVQEEAVNQETNNGSIEEPKLIETVQQPEVQHMNGNGIDKKAKPRTSNEIKMVQSANGLPKDVIRANDPPEDDLPKNIGVNKFVNFFESLGGKKK